jgi:hypothetical protein
VMFVTRENSFLCWNHKIFINGLLMWQEHGIWAPAQWLSWAKLLNVLSTCREWDR